MKYSTNDDNHYSLHNVDNFKSSLTINVNVILEKYINLLTQYLKFVIETLKSKNKSFTNFIIIRGMDTLTNVFNNILYYTKNLELTYFHCQKAYYYYIEFIEQITDDQHSFLQLSSKDAISYVYKKTIYEINNEFRKNIDANLGNCKDDAKKFHLITWHVKLFKKLSYKVANDKNFIVSSINDSIYIDRLDNVLNKINALNIDSDNITMFYSFVDLLDSKIEDISKTIDIIVLLTKKLNKNNGVISKINEKIYLDDFDEKLEDVNEKFVNWLLN